MARRRGRRACRASTSIIAVASGKGGVGKSTTAVNLALGLRDLGMKVGILDADIYGPSLPKLLAIREKPQTIGGTRLKPIERYGLTVMSIGFLIEEETPMIWRGPMVMSALTQMLREVEWGTLDVMVVDMPPGTGDAQLTMAQQVPLKGAVIVSTPQDLALIDARRGIAMFKRVNVPVLGIVENMSMFICPKCGTRSDIFGHGGAHHEAERLGVPFLGEVPLRNVDPRNLRRRPADCRHPARQRQRGGLSRHRRQGPRSAWRGGAVQDRAQDRDRGLDRTNWPKPTYSMRLRASTARNSTAFRASSDAADTASIERRYCQTAALAQSERVRHETSSIPETARCRVAAASAVATPAIAQSMPELKWR